MAQRRSSRRLEDAPRDDGCRWVREQNSELCVAVEGVQGVCGVVDCNEGFEGA